MSPSSGEAETLLVAGTASHVGKSTVAAGLCRLISDAGADVAPYKAQNMSNNARVAPTHKNGAGEMGVSQYTQAEAARTPVTTDMNPVLLKPRGDGESQVVVHGDAVGHYTSSEYYEEMWQEARDAAVASYRRIASRYDVVVAEGAGSVAEINLHHRDMSNLETARFADASVVLVADIERGGVFASLVGSLELVPDDFRDRVAGVVINKFRGDPSVLDPGLREFEDRTGVPVLGVLPYTDIGLPEEDSVSLPAESETTRLGGDDAAVEVAVPRLPRISNFTDLAPLERLLDVSVAYTPLDASLDAADAVVLPGTKNTVDDLLEAREAGLGDELRDFDGTVLGVCGGYQMLGECIRAAGVESTTEDGTVEAFGLLPVETEFSREKRVERTTVTVGSEGDGFLSDVAGEVGGYEIHMGATRPLTRELTSPLDGSSATVGDVHGTYLHGLFENTSVLRAFVDHLHGDGTEAAVPDHTPYTDVASLVHENLDLTALPVLSPEHTLP